MASPNPASDSSFERHLSSTKPHLFLTQKQLSVPSYFLYPHFRSKTGCCVYVRNDLTCSHAHALESSEFCTIWLRFNGVFRTIGCHRVPEWMFGGHVFRSGERCGAGGGQCTTGDEVKGRERQDSLGLGVWSKCSVLQYILITYGLFGLASTLWNCGSRTNH
ncbi:hypothetical protein E2C01_038852 [Portunus trituberculatus]|uniref:Uncharacterized protein n=1 Tax=Portunus trituberculatus TaxID=210409 RepID=A0A5B7FL64_PORTR|nr:hypothetical protein [Portunus trituberculatus]